MLGRLLRLLRRSRTTRDIGAHWEHVAARALRRKGYKIITRNWHGSRGEIDIVAWDGPSLVFVEVRARPATAAVSGYHSITAHKRRVLDQACQEYLRSLRPQPRHHRLDVVDIAHSSRKHYSLRHFQAV